MSESRSKFAFQIAAKPTYHDSDAVYMMPNTRLGL